MQYEQNLRDNRYIVGEGLDLGRVSLLSSNEAINRDRVESSLVSGAIEEIATVFNGVLAHPIFESVERSSQLKLQRFFGEQDAELKNNGTSGKPIFFSAEHQKPVISLPDLELYLIRFGERWDSDRDGVLRALRGFALNRVEFGIHEYGHIAGYNKAIIADPKLKRELAGQRERLEELLHCWPDPEIGLNRIPHILSDLKAEVFRLQILPLDNPVRDPQSFSRIGVEERVLEDGVIRCRALNPDSVLRMLVWYPICQAFGPEGSAEQVVEAISERCRKYNPSLLPLLDLAKDYFSLYFHAREYDQERFLEAIGG